MEKEEPRQPKMLYCKGCDIFIKPILHLNCPKCSNRLTTCWWALTNGVKEARKYCTNCNNRYWCWTNVPDDRIPSFSQARIVQNKKGLL